MTSAPTNPFDVPPYQVQDLISSVIDGGEPGEIHVRCAQAIGSDIYVGCSNGELIRFALQVDDPNQPHSYQILSRQLVHNGKPVDEIVLVPCLSRAFVLSGNVLYFYSIPFLDLILTPIKHVQAFTVDHRDFQRPPASFSNPITTTDSITFCVVKRFVKRISLATYSMGERNSFLLENELPSRLTMIRRIGDRICMADEENYSTFNLESGMQIPVVPVSQVETTTPVKPSITVIGEDEFLVASCNGEGAIGIFITGEGDPVRGTLQWPSHPEAICYDYPYITTLLQNNTIEIHSVETQAIVQVVSAPLESCDLNSHLRRLNVISSLNGYLVPFQQDMDKTRSTAVKLLRT